MEVTAWRGEGLRAEIWPNLSAPRHSSTAVQAVQPPASTRHYVSASANYHHGEYSRSRADVPVPLAARCARRQRALQAREVFDTMLNSNIT